MQEEQEGIDESQYRTIEEILQASKDSVSKLKEEIEFMENNERTETLESVQNSIKADNMNTVRKKEKFINDITSGLIKDIKRNKGVKRVEPKKEPKKDVIKNAIISIFKKF